MADPFWEHWRAFLEREPADSPTIELSASRLAPRVSSQSIDLALPPVGVDSLSLRSVTIRSRRLPALTCRVESHRFVAAPEPPTPAGEASRPRTRRNVLPMPRVRPPSGIPLREQLLAMLQPPISGLLADNRLWLPFEPFGYQYEGIHFLSQRWSALLADEMGLGKTMQTILSLRLLWRSGMIHSALLVCPKPLVPNWVREFELWAEELPVRVVQGDSAARRSIWLHDRSAVRIASYESLRGDAPILHTDQVRFDVVVLDEAQRIKSHDSQTAQVVHGLRRKRSWALTGTPVENRASDLASILQFVHQRPIRVDERVDTLRDELANVLLRRTKDMVLDDLPPKRIHDTYIDLGPRQRKSYHDAETEGVLRLNHLGESITIEHVFDLIRHLKQICNFDPATGESAKADQLLADLEEIAGSGQKAVVFSQWVGTLETLAERLRGFHPLVFHGKVRPREREQVLAKFRDGPKHVALLISYGTGSVGLNLQFANYAFLFDRWWNPAIEDQAINRVHRIGQRQRVFVSRFISPGTIEERIAQVLARKRELSAFLLDDHDPVESGLTKDDVFGLFDLKVRTEGE